MRNQEKANTCWKQCNITSEQSNINFHIGSSAQISNQFSTGYCVAVVFTSVFIDSKPSYKSEVATFQISNFTALRDKPKDVCVEDYTFWGTAFFWNCYFPNLTVLILECINKTKTTIVYSRSERTRTLIKKCEDNFDGERDYSHQLTFH